MARPPRQKDSLLGAAVVKTILLRTGAAGGTSLLYEGLLRDLRLTDADVDRYVAQHGPEIEEAIKSHGRRSPG